MQDEISKMAQENILTLLAFDNDSCALLSSLDIKLFGSDIYRNIASNCINYYKAFKQSPASHLPDLLEAYLTNKDENISDIYKRILINLNDNKDRVNKDYVLKNLQSFLSLQNLKLGICKAFDYIQSNDIEKAKKCLTEGLSSGNIIQFDMGTMFTSTSISKILNKQSDLELMYTGIPELDNIYVCPARKEQLTLFSLPNVGKSQFLVYMGKMCAMQRYKVLHVTLEMSEEKTCRRYIQSFFAVGKRQGSVLSHLLFNVNDNGKFLGTEEYKPDDSLVFGDKKTNDYILQTLEDLKHIQLVVKEFPSGFLTIDLLIQYMDMLEARSGFIPDVLIIDYPDLMRVNAANLRTEIGRIFVNLRGIAGERNLANINVTQCNRTGIDIPVLTSKHLAEDFSKIFTADNAISLNQTETEYKRGLARMFVVKAREELKNDLIIISQNFSIGQFYINSAKMSKTYESYIKGETCEGD